MSDVTRILNAIERGDAKDMDELLPLAHEELRVSSHEFMLAPNSESCKAERVCGHVSLRRWFDTGTTA